jgi:hypothetical protein
MVPSSLARLSSLVLLVFPATSWAMAQSADLPATASTTRTYTPDDFARFAPRTALDMLNQVPGFAIRVVEERRGFGQGSGNVVINGERISGKSNDAVTELNRIPAARVVRIDVVDGATLGIPGLAGQVANIVIKAGSVEVNYEWTPSYRPKIDQFRFADGSVSASGSRGPLSFSLGLDTNSYAGGGIGPEFVTDPTGRLIDFREENGHFFGYQPRLSGSLKYERATGEVANLNGIYERTYGNQREISIRTGIGSPDRDRRFRSGDRSWSYELGGDYEFGLGGGRLKIIGLRRDGHSPTFSLVTTSFAGGRPAEGTRYEVEADETEAIARAEYRWKTGASSWQMSVEGAFNTLDSTAALSTLTPEGAFIPEPLPGATSRIEEKRAEAILSFDRPLSDALSVQAAAGAEYSNLRQIGANGLDRTFYRPKGSLALGWKASPRLTVNARLERQVGQLQFSSFLASVNIIGGNENSGNPNLVPQQSWNGQVEAIRNFGALGRATLRLYGRLVTDIVDQIPIGEKGESPGNLDSATIYGLELTSTVKFDPLGWKGAKLDVNLAVQDSEVEDPLTGLPRRISVSLRRRIDVRLRHDVPGSDWAWGSSFVEQRNYDNFRLSEISNLYNPSSVTAFVENKDVKGLKVRATVGNIFGTNESYRRAVYVRRRDGPLAFVERRTRAYGPIFQLSVSGSL